MRAVNKEVRSLLLNQDKTNEKIIIPACCGSRSDGCGEHPTKMNVTMRSGDVITYQIADIDSIWFSGESTTPTPVAAENNGPDVIYDLSGRRLRSIDAAGIYIVNGKKVVIK